MAQSIKNNVTNINAGPKKRTSAKAKAALEAQRLKDDEGRGLKGPKVDDDRDPEDERTAPGFGHNAPDESVYLRNVHAIRRQKDVVAAAKLVVKTENGKLKDIRKLAQADGLVMKQLDAALESLETEHVDLIAAHKRTILYHSWLGMPLEEQQELNLHAKEGDAELDAKRWRRRGDVDGRLGRVRDVPVGCPPEHIQDYLKGHDLGQEALMRGLPLTRDGFGDQAPAPAAQEDASKVLMLNEGHFAAGTILEDANTSTLLPEHLPAVERAIYVSAVFGPAKRLIKEPGYLDDGSENTEVTEPEVVVPDASELA